MTVHTRMHAHHTLAHAHAPLLHRLANNEIKLLKAQAHATSSQGYRRGLEWIEGDFDL